MSEQINTIDKDALLERLLENPNQAIRASGGLSLFEFIEEFWDEISDDTFSPNWHIEYLCKELEQVAYRVAEKKPKLYDLIINIPPGTTKTITCSIMYPIWCWAEVGYWMRFITSSYSATLALESAEKSRDIIRSDKFRYLYPELDVKQDKDVKSNFRVVKKVRMKPGVAPRIELGGSRYSTSVGGTLTGFHGHILIVDDPLNPQQAVSEKELENCNRWMEQTLPTRKTDKAVSATILVMQRLHQGDPTGRLLEKKKEKLRHICLPGELGAYEQFVKPVELVKNYKQGLLDVNRLGREILTELEVDLGQYGYAGQVGQNPTPPGGGMFKVERMPIVHHLSSETNIVRKVRYWDKAGTQGGGARTAGVRMELLKSGKVIIRHIKKGQWGTDDREAVIKATTEADGHDVIVWIEQEPGSGGKESAEATIRNLRGFSVHADRPTGDKVYRADPFSVAVNNGDVIMIEGEWNADFVNEMTLFPNGRFKDQVDAAAGAYNKLMGRKTVRVLTKSKRR